MKSFIIASILLALLSGAVCINTVALTSKITEIKEMSAELREKPREEWAQAVKRIQDAWRERRLFFALSVNQAELEKMDDTLARLYAAAEYKSDSDYYITVADLEEAISLLERLICFCPEGIL